MKRLLLKIGLLVLMVAVLDALIGKVFSCLENHAKGGDTYRNVYICHKTHEDVLIFGSSRALQHYNPTIFSDSLGMSCYNCAQKGYGIILDYGYSQIITQRYRPKLIICDIFPLYDLLAAEDNGKYLGWLRTSYEETGVPEIFKAVDATEPYKMQSLMYRYNSRFVQILSDNVHPLQSTDINGFRPFYNEIDTLRVIDDEQTELGFDSLKIAFVRKMIKSMDGVRLVFVVSPHWSGIDPASLQPIRDICEDTDTPFFDFSNDPKYLHRHTYFADPLHLNARGADEFTRDFVHILKERHIIQ